MSQTLWKYRMLFLPISYVEHKRLINMQMSSYWDMLRLIKSLLSSHVQPQPFMTEKNVPDLETDYFSAEKLFVLKIE